MAMAAMAEAETVAEVMARAARAAAKMVVAEEQGR